MQVGQKRGVVFLRSMKLYVQMLQSLKPAMLRNFRILYNCKRHVQHLRICSGFVLVLRSLKKHVQALTINQKLLRLN